MTTSSRSAPGSARSPWPCWRPARGSPRSSSTTASSRCSARSCRRPRSWPATPASSTGRRCWTASRRCSWPTCRTTWRPRSSPTCSTTCPLVERMLVMVQAEVGERLAAGPGTKAYGAVSVKVAYWAEAVRRRTGAADGVPPPPEGRLGARRHPPAPRARRSAVGPARATCSRLVRAGFGQRRKTLRRSLAELATEDDFVAAGIDPGARAEQLDVDAWGRLALAVPSAGPRHDDRPRRSVRAPAKLTLSLRSHRGAGGRLPPARRRDGDARAGRHAHVRRRRRG